MVSETCAPGACQKTRFIDLRRRSSVLHQSPGAVTRSSLRSDGLTRHSPDSRRLHPKSPRFAASDKSEEPPRFVDRRPGVPTLDDWSQLRQEPPFNPKQSRERYRPTAALALTFGLDCLAASHGRTELLPPAAPFEPYEWNKRAHSYDTKAKFVAVSPFKFRHVLEVHSPHAREEGGWNADYGNDS